MNHRVSSQLIAAGHDPEMRQANRKNFAWLRFLGLIRLEVGVKTASRAVGHIGSAQLRSTQPICGNFRSSVGLVSIRLIVRAVTGPLNINGPVCTASAAVRNPVLHCEERVAHFLALFGCGDAGQQRNDFGLLAGGVFVHFRGELGERRFELV